MFRQKAWFNHGIGVLYKFEVVFYSHPFHKLEKRLILSEFPTCSWTCFTCVKRINDLFILQFSTILFSK